MGDDDATMGDAPVPPAFGGGASGDWGAEVEAEHEASGRNADVLEAERAKARARAERFGMEYKSPSAKTLAGANGLLSRREVLAMRKEAAMKRAAKQGQFVTGIDLFDPAEEAKRRARAEKFGAMLTTPGPDEQALIDKREAERAARAARAADGGGEETGGGGDAAMDAGADAQDTLEARVDPDLDAKWRSDAVHLYGVDHMTTNECMGYFGEYGPVFCEWINDSSCNVVFADETTARRAIRMKGEPLGAAANPDEKGALPEGLEAEMLWHGGPEFFKNGKTLQLSFRLATEDDIKPHGRIKSRQLWMNRNERGANRGKRRRGGQGGGGDRGGDREMRDDRDDSRGGKRRRRRGGGGGGGMRGFGDDGDGGVADLRERLKKKRAEREEGGGEAAGDAAMMPMGGGDGGADASADKAEVKRDSEKAAVGMMAAAVGAAAAARKAEAEPSKPEDVKME